MSGLRYINRKGHQDASRVFDLFELRSIKNRTTTNKNFRGHEKRSEKKGKDVILITNLVSKVNKLANGININPQQQILLRTHAIFNKTQILINIVVF